VLLLPVKIADGSDPFVQLLRVSRLYPLHFHLFPVEKYVQYRYKKKYNFVATSRALLQIGH
jgi:hypothetical protein